MTTILIVEDEQAPRTFFSRLLRPYYKVVEAANVVEAVEAARRIRPDLVLLDLNLETEHDGLEVCRTLRGEPDPALAQVPILMLTGQTSQTVIAAALAAGVDSYVGKTYSPHSLLALIEILLVKKGNR